MDSTPKMCKQNSVLLSSQHLDNSSPGGCHSVGKTMSVSLKERLKKSRRSFTSPLSVAKRLRIDGEDAPQPSSQNEVGHRIPVQKEDVNGNETALRESPKACPDSNQSHVPVSEPVPVSCANLLQQRDVLKRELKEKTETLRRLNMVKMYRTKNDLTQLRSLISKWRSCAQAVLYQLQTELPTDGRKASLSQLIDHFGLEDGILHFDRAEEDFIDK